MLQLRQEAFFRHDDCFPQNTPDTEWLPQVGERGWLVITLDLRIRYNPLEKLALTRSGVGAFIIVGKNLSGVLLAACIERALPKMKEFAQRHPRPFIAKVYADGRIQLLNLTTEK